jgi:hypothetical protein
MAGPNTSDLTLTHYPVAIDHNVEGASLPLLYNPDFELNADFGSEDAAGENYVVRADDINVLAHAIMAIERTLGPIPYGDADTVSLRIGAIEDFLENPAAFDERYGGINWGTNIVGVTWPTILSHKHRGGAYNPTKVDLGEEVQGKLPIANLPLESSETTPLTSADIIYTKADSASIKSKLDSKIGVSGNYTITGDLIFQGHLVSRLFAEYDMKDMAGQAGTTNCTAVVDATAFSGQALKASSANGSTKVSVPVRFGWQSINLRCKISSADKAVAGNKLIVSISNAGMTDAISTTTLTAANFETADVWQNFSFKFEHTNSTVTPSNKNMIVTITFPTTGVSIDSLVVIPQGIALWAENA